MICILLPFYLPILLFFKNFQKLYLVLLLIQFLINKNFKPGVVVYSILLTYFLTLEPLRNIKRLEIEEIKPNQLIYLEIKICDFQKRYFIPRNVSGDKRKEISDFLLKENILLKFTAEDNQISSD
jgi:hypothetical protein